MAGLATAVLQPVFASATGSVSRFQALARDGSPVFDGTVGTSGADLNLDSVHIAAGGQITIATLTVAVQ